MVVAGPGAGLAMSWVAAAVDFSARDTRCLIRAEKSTDKVAEKSANRVVHKVDMWEGRDHSGAKWRTNHGPVRPTED